jgi:hypothetical protein
MNFTALHRVLGRAPGPLADEMIDEAVRLGIAETDDLDFKSKLPPAKGLPDTDYPKDIAAMANSGGGLIVYGVKDVQKAASARCDVGELGETYERTLRDVAVTAISPPIFGLEVYRLGQPGAQAVAIVVPGSVDGPHLIYRGEYFGAPFRNDADTVWMKERQVEAMYRVRFDERRHATEALDNLYNQLASARDVSEHPWLIMVGHPRLPSIVGARLTREDARRVFEDSRTEAGTYAAGGGRPLDAVNWHNPRIGLRSWIAPSNSASRHARWQASEASVHDDGSATLATTAGGAPMPPRGEHAPNNHVDSSLIEVAIADFLALVRVASQNRGTGEYEIRVGIAWSGEESLVVHRFDPRGFGGEDHALSPSGYPPIVSAVDARADADSYLRQVWDLVQDCLNQVGIETPRLINSPATHELDE